MISKEAWAVGVCIVVLLLCGWLLTRDLDLPPVPVRDVCPF